MDLGVISGSRRADVLNDERSGRRQNLDEGGAERAVRCCWGILCCVVLPPCVLDGLLEVALEGHCPQWRNGQISGCVWNSTTRRLAGFEPRHCGYSDAGGWL